MRSARLARKRIGKTREYYRMNIPMYPKRGIDEAFELQKGDKMTGFEIIASLPLEVQKKMSLLANVPGYFGLSMSEKYLTDIGMWQRALWLTYEWNGEKWTEVSE